MPDYFNYQKSIAAEFKAYEKRVRNLIDDAHWGEEGRYKEIILMNYLKRVLPKNVSVGTGFIRNGERITSQIDIIIYDNEFPVLFSEGDFIITTPQNLIGIIEVKSNIRPHQLCDIIVKANENGSIIAGDKILSIFNGIFTYNAEHRSKNYLEKIQDLDLSPILERQHFNQVFSNKLLSCVNHIVLGNDKFIKLWPNMYNEEFSNYANYSIYNLQEGLAFSYFLSNLQEIIVRRSLNNYTDELPEELQSFYYPIREGKEVHKCGEAIFQY